MYLASGLIGTNRTNAEFPIPRRPRMSYLILSYFVLSFLILLFQFCCFNFCWVVKSHAHFHFSKSTCDFLVMWLVGPTTPTRKFNNINFTTSKWVCAWLKTQWQGGRRRPAMTRRGPMWCQTRCLGLSESFLYFFFCVYYTNWYLGSTLLNRQQGPNNARHVIWA